MLLSVACVLTLATWRHVQSDQSLMLLFFFLACISKMNQSLGGVRGGGRSEVSLLVTWLS